MHPELASYLRVEVRELEAGGLSRCLHLRALELGYGPILTGDLRVPETSRYSAHMSIYRVHDTTGEDLGLLEHPAPNLEPDDVVVLADGREGVVTARVEAEPGPGPLVATLEVLVSPDRVRPT